MTCSTYALAEANMPSCWDLVDLTQRQPLDERIAGQLMLALYRSGRPTDALTHYHHMRTRLADESGTDPSPPLRQLHQRILTADPTLTAPTPGPTTTRSSVPRQLPGPPRLFTGRSTELAQLDKHTDTPGAVVISAIGGTGGIGKTWLALHWAHQRLDRFPDGQLHANLRGFDPTDQPLSPTTALRGFLGALGVAPAAIPAELDAQVGMYRSRVAVSARGAVRRDESRAHVGPSALLAMRMVAANVLLVPGDRDARPRASLSPGLLLSWFRSRRVRRGRAR